MLFHRATSSSFRTTLMNLAQVTKRAIFSHQFRPVLGPKQLYSIRRMHIQSIPMCKYSLIVPAGKSITKSETNSLPGEGSSDNYAYIVVDDKSKKAIIIDPANPDE